MVNSVLPYTTTSHPNAQRLAVTLLVAAVLVILWSGWSPVDRGDWLLENGLVALAVTILVYGYRQLRFSSMSYVALFVFLCLHEVGAHYTYSQVPFAHWIERVMPPGWVRIIDPARNDYDRAVHFAYGFLVLPAAVELFARRAPPQGLWRWILPVTFVMAHSTIYELVEWAAAAVFGGDLGQMYLGTQGDEWDAQKDMFMATVGSVVAMILLAALRRRSRAME